MAATRHASHDATTASETLPRPTTPPALPPNINLDALDVIPAVARVLARVRDPTGDAAGTGTGTGTGPAGLLTSSDTPPASGGAGSGSGSGAGTGRAASNPRQAASPSSSTSPSRAGSTQPATTTTTTKKEEGGKGHGDPFDPTVMDTLRLTTELALRDVPRHGDIIRRRLLDVRDEMLGLPDMQRDVAQQEEEMASLERLIERRKSVLTALKRGGPGSRPSEGKPGQSADGVADEMDLGG